MSVNSGNYPELNNALNALRLEVAPSIANHIREKVEEALFGDNPIQRNAIWDVVQERRRQEQKWGEQNHDPIIWTAVLTEEVGEFSESALHHRFGGKHGSYQRLREEATHCAAVGLSILECLERNKEDYESATDAFGVPYNK